MSIALAQEVKKLSVELAYLRQIVEKQDEQIEFLRHALAELSIDLDEPVSADPVPVKRGPGRPRKVTQQ